MLSGFGFAAEDRRAPGSGCILSCVFRWASLERVSRRMVPMIPLELGREACCRAFLPVPESLARSTGSEEEQEGARGDGSVDSWVV